MSSGFVSGGTVDAPIERDDEWLAAQKEIEANLRRKAELARQENGKSLFETLEANKAAKQEAFEEANRIKNQFRALDDDEVEFLNSVLESTRAEEDRVKRETAEGLALFRQQQEEADKKAQRGSGDLIAEEGLPSIEDESWVTGGRKRKRAKEKEVLKGIKIRRSSTATENKSPDKKMEQEAEAVGTPPKPIPSSQSTCEPAESKANTEGITKTESFAKRAPIGSTLVNYGSDEDDDW